LQKTSAVSEKKLSHKLCRAHVREINFAKNIPLITVTSIMAEENEEAFCNYCDFKPVDPNNPERNCMSFPNGDDGYLSACNVCATRMNEEDMLLVRSINVFTINTL
jgi:hypothetical protein